MPRGEAEKPESIQSILARVQTPFLERTVEELPDWIRDQPGLSVEVQGHSRHMIRAGGPRIAMFSFQSGWLYCWLHPYDLGEVQLLRSRLSEPESVSENDPGPKYLRFHVSNERDLELFKELLLNRRDAAAGRG